MSGKSLFSRFGIAAAAAGLIGFGLPTATRSPRSPPLSPTGPQTRPATPRASTRHRLRNMRKPQYGQQPQYQQPPAYGQQQLRHSRNLNRRYPQQGYPQQQQTYNDPNQALLRRIQPSAAL